MGYTATKIVKVVLDEDSLKELLAFMHGDSGSVPCPPKGEKGVVLKGWIKEGTAPAHGLFEQLPFVTLLRDIATRPQREGGEISFSHGVVLKVQTLLVAAETDDKGYFRCHNIEVPRKFLIGLYEVIGMLHKKVSK
jgi:hypothetical protein